MKLYETDFLQKMVTLLKEAFKFKKYKAMPAVLAVFTGILMIPIVISSFFAVAWLSILGFVFTVLSAPVKYLHEIVNQEGQGVKHATQTAIYLISWPTVFFLYVLMSALLLLLIPAYAIFAFSTYVWSLGGFKFHLFANAADDISIEVKGTYKLLPLVFVLVGGMLLVVMPAFHGAIRFVELYELYLERYFLVEFIGIYTIYVMLHSAFATLYSLIGFAPNPKEVAVEEVELEAEA